MSSFLAKAVLFRGPEGLLASRIDWKFRRIREFGEKERAGLEEEPNELQPLPLVAAAEKGMSD